ncbi:hypothetical protein B1R32_1199 [Abditibacterium utsteinense]|uniref:Uncharacterized protein n=2 Tax=Abditibacterium utsteinense TaxID=1960156 RepID=A0A2S8SQ29_9BACT|nr:hypothetical protein B1R32_1199 [Abditibacterium utsteinense]
MAKIGAATLTFAAWHSLLCSDGAKNSARALLGARRGTGWYRAFFMAQSALTTGALVLYVLRQPHRIVYQARGAMKILGWAGQIASLGVAALALRELDTAKFIGCKGVKETRKSVSADEIEEAQAQGPELENHDTEIRATGVFRFSRHPLEWAPIALLFFSPTLKTNWLAFDLLAAVYSVVGALHEEKRLERQSEAYAKYQKQVSFWVGKPKF